MHISIKPRSFQIFAFKFNRSALTMLLNLFVNFLQISRFMCPTKMTSLVANQSIGLRKSGTFKHFYRCFYNFFAGDRASIKIMIIFSNFSQVVEIHRVKGPHTGRVTTCSSESSNESKENSFQSCVHKK